MKNNSRYILSDPFIFVLATAITVSVLFLHISYSILQGSSILLLITALLLIQQIEKSTTTYTQLFSKLLTFCLTLSMQLLTIATGGLTSHFLLMAALFAFALSFIRNIFSSLVFLLLFSVPLGIQLVLDTKLRIALADDPAIIFLFLLVYIFATIFSYILNSHYHVKDVFLEVMEKQVKLHEIREQTILSGVQELIIITDRKLHIISVNNAVEKTIIVPKTELIGKPIFAHLLLKNELGQLISESSLPLEKIFTEKLPITVKNISLLIDQGSSNLTYTLTVKPINELEGKVDQVLFIVRNEDIQLKESHQNEQFLDQIITKQAALIEGLKRNLQERGLLDIASKAELIGKIDREIRQFLALERSEDEIVVAPVNSALIVRSTIEAMESFSKILGVELECMLMDIDSNSSAGYAAHKNEMEYRIHSLYTVRANLFWLEVLLHKLIELAILLSSTDEKKLAVISLKRINSQVLITVKAYNTHIKEENKKSLFVVNYDDLQSTTNLSLASGLEGYIAKRISDRLEIPIALHVQENEIQFSLLINAVS